MDIATARPPRSSRWPRRAGAAAIAAGLALVLTGGSARAQPNQPSGTSDEPPLPARTAAAPDRKRADLDWRYREFQTWEYGATGGLAGVTLASLFIPVGTGRWNPTNGFDSEVGDGLAPSNPTARERADDASDLLVAFGINHLLLDSMVVAWAIRGRGAVGYQMAMIDAEALAVNLAVTNLLKSTVARPRPYSTDCDANPVYARRAECQQSERYKSFLSGHTSTAFTIAGLTCMHHAHLPLYGGGAPDALACASAFAAASAVGTLRVVSHDHHPTDVLAGAALGAASGLGLPWLLHYRFRRPSVSTSNERATGLSVRVIPAPNGGALAGEF